MVLDLTGCKNVTSSGIQSVAYNSSSLQVFRAPNLANALTDVELRAFSSAGPSHLVSMDLTGCSAVTSAGLERIIRQSSQLKCVVWQMGRGMGERERTHISPRSRIPAPARERSSPRAEAPIPTKAKLTQTTLPFRLSLSVLSLSLSSLSLSLFSLSLFSLSLFSLSLSPPPPSDPHSQQAHLHLALWRCRQRRCHGRHGRTPFCGNAAC